MDVSLDVLGAVDLDDPIDGREVETSCGDISREEDRVFGGEESLVDLETLGLFLFAVHV